MKNTPQESKNSIGSKFKLVLKSAGPGIISGASGDDPAGIATYTVAGAQFGTQFLWTALITWPLMAFVQMACARIGMVTGCGLAAALRKKIPRPLLIVVCAALFVANTLNVGADLAAMADGAELLSGVPSLVFVFIFGITISWATVRFNYEQISSVLKWLALSLCSYIVVAFIAKPDWGEVLSKTLHPTFPEGAKGWGMLVAVFGTTISPYLFFWQASEEVEEDRAKGKSTLAERRGASADELLYRKVDVGVGTFFSNAVMWFIILAAALTLHAHGVTEVETSKQAADALVPIAGRGAAWLYTLGLLAVGFLAIPTLTGSTAFAIAETFHWKSGLSYKMRRAKSFYAVIIGSMVVAIIFDFAKVNPIKALYGSSIINGLVAPILLFVILFVIRDRKIMNDQPSSRLTQALILVTALMMTGAGVAMLVF